MCRIVFIHCISIQNTQFLTNVLVLIEGTYLSVQKQTNIPIFKVIFVYFSRKLEEEYNSFTASIEQKSLYSDPECESKPLCPICLERELDIEGAAVKDGQNICAECQNVVCTDCGSLQTSYSSRVSTSKTCIYLCSVTACW